MLVTAAVLAGAAAITLILVGWAVQDWQYISDWSDPTRWWGALIRGAGVLLFSKLGFKVALGVVFAAAGAVAWMRTRRKPAPGTPEVAPD